MARLPHFWESVGFCPPDPHQEVEKFVLSEDMKLNLALIGSLPGGATKQVRVHWLLNMIKANVSNGKIKFNFTFLDQFIGLLRKNRLKPGFELMGNPSKIFNDFENDTQLRQFKALVSKLSSRYEKMFGYDYLSQWNFESWNEPDHKDFDDFNMTLAGFLNYYDACSQGLKENFGHRLKLGGPAERCLPIRQNSFCWSLLRHIADGRNYFTGRKNDTKLDFISIHEKGEDGNIDLIIEKERNFLDAIDKMYPQLKQIPIVNDECDPSKGWSHPYRWKADANYAAFVATITMKHVANYFAKRSKRFRYLSNDNAFLSYFPYQFEQRTILARFQMNNTKPRSVQFIKKPIYSALGLFDLLGDTLIFSKIIGNKNNLNVVATSEVNEDKMIYAILFAHQNKSSDIFETNLSLKIEMIFGKSGKTFQWRHYLVDNIHTNPYALWLEKGRPAFPSESLLQSLRSLEGPFVASDANLNVKFNGNIWTFNFTSTAPSVSLLLFCSKSAHFNENVTEFRHHIISNSTVLFTWRPLNEKCVQTYELQYTKNLSIQFKRIKQNNIIFASYHHTSPHKSISGFYRVRGIDFWGRKGPFSNIIEVGVKFFLLPLR
ncbi:hypothetical protein B4U79_01656 [Dinothrombium tinctorium]|uniref:Uncharacterized protein n=1 Tax=Dinothrombium tinctorium TaxID=1965070 RepID=A0A3S5WGT2_9ACAR|nr:hypothetical protein B4U79_01656 [Dinothrombium tinctorium]